MRGSGRAAGWALGPALLLLLAAGAAAQPDPLLEQQWHLQGRAVEPAGANVRAAWPTTTGVGVVIGVVDTGLQSTHPDLQPNYLSALSFDFLDDDPDPSPVTAGACAEQGGPAECHGTAVAGLAGAQGENGLGGSGVAPAVGLAALRLVGRATSDAQEAAALGHEGQAIHISTNSWGPDDGGAILDLPGPLTQAAMDNAVQTGRDGKGRIYVWAAGNGRHNGDNCNFDGYVNRRDVIAVGAVGDDGQGAFYSEPCAALLVSAPSNGGSRGLTTTDLVGAAGYSPTDATSTFGGTSAAAPVVSGVIALMLAENPALTWRDVQHILVQSSDATVDGADPGWSAGPFPHHEQYGFGLVDAEAAVSLAAGWTPVPPEDAVPEVARSFNLPIPDNDAAGLTDSITIDAAFADLTVEHVDVLVTALHPRRGELEVTLTSPTGVVSRLGPVRPNDAGSNFIFWRFGSVRHWGESAAGTWTLRVADRAPGSTGTWRDWRLRIYGVADGSPPETTITGGPSSTTTATSATFAWTGSDDVTPTGSIVYASRLHPLEPSFSPFGNATSRNYTDLAAGTYTFYVKARDRSGNVDATPDSRTFTVVSDVQLSVSISGSGRVTSRPGGISCPGGCSSTYPWGTSVTLTAAPAPGWTFSAWHGSGCAGTGSCTVNLTVDATLAATFTAMPPLEGLPPGSSSAADVPTDHWARPWIEALISTGVTAGCSVNPLLYCLESPVTREQMAVFLLRAQNVTPPQCTIAPFPDVPCSSPFGPWIAELVRRGITVGCGGGLYCPAAPVTRGQMAVFLLRALGVTPPACVVPTFGDVACSSLFAAWIEELVGRGITAGCSTTPALYCPTNRVTRAEMAVFLVGTFSLPF